MSSCCPPSSSCSTAQAETDTQIKETFSVCPICHARIGAVVTARSGEVWMDKTCDEHGSFSVRMSSSPDHYYLAEAKGDGGCCGSSKAEGGSLFDQLSTCIALIEIVTDCNLACPTCYADSPQRTSKADHSQSVPRDEIQRRIEAVTERKGSIDIVQLSGGEPTLHPEFIDILRWCIEHPQIGYVLVNTNGVRLARDEAFAQALVDLRRSHPRGFEIYLQFDGPQREGQLALRGADLREIRKQVIADCATANIPVTLAVTVNQDTLPFLGDTLRFGLSEPTCRGITFQPATDSGRMSEETRSEARPLSVADIARALRTQAPELVTQETFTPLPCGDPNCHSIGYLLRTKAKTIDLSSLVNYAEMSSFLENRVDYRLEDLAQCGCEVEPLGQLLRETELGPNAPFRLFIKPFMSAWNYDEDRIKRCCTHVITEDGELDSFCRHYLGQPEHLRPQRSNRSLPLAP